MIENKLEMDIIGLYDSNLVNLFSINQIAHFLGKKYPYINKKVTDLLNEGILRKTVVGKSYLCSLNMENEKTILLLCLQELKKKQKARQLQKVEDFVKNNQMDITIHCILKYNSKLLFVIENIRDRRKITRSFPDAVVADKTEFLDILSEEPKIFKSRTVLYGAERFYELLSLELDELKKLYSPLRY